MSLPYNGLLDAEYWDDVTPNVKLSLPTRISKSLTDLLRPSFLTRSAISSGGPSSGSPRKPLGRTAYLDGLRGFAAFLVYWHHNQLWCHQGGTTGGRFEKGFGYEGYHYFAAFHGVRTFFTGGHFAVTVFFVISGYVLAAKPLSLMHAGDFVKLGDSLASALFRRWLRLYTPVIMSTFVTLTMWHMFGIWTEAGREPKYRDELWKWYAEFKNFSFVFNAGGDPWFSYDVHVWSIPVEFRGSIVVYTALLAFSRCTRNARLWCEAGLIFYFMYIADGSYNAMFVAGMLICDLDLLAANNQLPSFLSRMEPFKELIYYHLFFISIYLGGIPSHNSDIQVLKASPGWYFLSYLKPQAVFDYKWFYLFWAATFLVSSIPRIPWLKHFFEMPFNQYLGRISFALYLAHGPVIRILGDRLYAATGWVRPSQPIAIPGWTNAFPLSKAGPLGMELSFLVPHLILLPVTLWLAEIGTKLIDKPSVKFAQWLYGMTQPPSTKS